MLFKINGVDAQGRKREISVDAVSEADALRRVAEMGITVTAAKELTMSAPGKAREAYPALLKYATIARVSGWLTIVFAVIEAILVGSAKDGSGAIAFGILVVGIVGGIGELAFAELLHLFVRLHANTQYICERLYALEQQARSANRP